MEKKYKLIIFDADGTLRGCKVEGQPCPNKPDQSYILPGVKEKFAQLDFGPEGIFIGIASNQAGVSLGYLTLNQAYQMLCDLFVELTEHWPLTGLIQVCPHGLDVGCMCRKPEAGMLRRVMLTAGVGATETLFVGDMESDQQAAERVGVDFMWAKDFFNSENK